MRVEIRIKNYLSEIDLKSKPISEKKKIFQIVLNTAHQSRRISQSIDIWRPTRTQLSVEIFNFFS